MVMLVILIVGGSAMLLNSLNSTTPRLARDKVTTDALAQAKEALIGYAITYADTHTNVNGFLPCPDQGQNSTQDGSANNSCAATGISAMGKFPWKTLGLLPLKDASGECFWYAVSGTYKNNPDAEMMNWDNNNGQFQIMAPDGVSFIAGSSADNLPVAVIFSPGAPLGTQARTPESNTPSCGGNYVASNYLDNDTIHNINNATTAVTANSVTQFINAQVKDVSANEIVNDRLIFITKDEIFNIIKKRNDIASAPINQAVSCLAALPDPKTIDFDTMNESSGISHGMGMNQLTTGRISKDNCKVITDPNNINVQKWRDNLAYAKCNSGTCLTVNGSSCKGVIIFTGERIAATQNRVSNADKNSWSNYLEGSALNVFTSGTTTLAGATTYNPATPSTDVLACIP